MAAGGRGAGGTGAGRADLAAALSPAADAGLDRRGARADALRARRDRIPEEREKEIAAIESRYSDLSHRTFPVAVTFILPRTTTGGSR